MAPVQRWPPLCMMLAAVSQGSVLARAGLLSLSTRPYFMARDHSWPTVRDFQLRLRWCPGAAVIATETPTIRRALESWRALKPEKVGRPTPDHRSQMRAPDATRHASLPASRSPARPLGARTNIPAMRARPVKPGLPGPTPTAATSGASSPLFLKRRDSLNTLSCHAMPACWLAVTSAVSHTSLEENVPTYLVVSAKWVFRGARKQGSVLSITVYGSRVRLVYSNTLNGPWQDRRRSPSSMLVTQGVSMQEHASSHQRAPPKRAILACTVSPENFYPPAWWEESHVDGFCSCPE